jgi:hypothetical protein
MMKTFCRPDAAAMAMQTAARLNAAVFRCEGLRLRRIHRRPGMAKDADRQLRLIISLRWHYPAASFKRRRHLA